MPVEEELGLRVIRSARSRRAVAAAMAATSREWHIAKGETAGTRNDPTVQQRPVLSAEDLSVAVYTLNARMDAPQQWTDTIAALGDDHANQLEAAARKIFVARATLTALRDFVQ